MSLLVSACGFSLRSNIVLPEQLSSLRVIAVTENSEFIRILKRSLQKAGANLDQPEGKSFLLEIGREVNNQRTISINRQAKAGEYELYMSIPYALYNDQESVVNSGLLQAEKYYLADAYNISGNIDE